MPTAGASTTAAGRTGSQDESDVGAVDPEDMDTLKRKRVAGAGYHPHSDDGRGRMHAGHHSGGGILPVFGDAASKGARVHVSLRVTCTPLRLQLACLAVLLAVPAYILVALALVAADSRVHMMRRMTSISILPSTGEGGQEPEDPLEIAIITLGDCRKNWGRNFQGINEATIDNKAAYAVRAESPAGRCRHAPRSCISHPRAAQRCNVGPAQARGFGCWPLDSQRMLELS
mmetsp:Transcript_26259/g.83908  ORF Transcript_26259/g.83908 Transcript_26259/m.83908 type:complete len:230 (-) Transcript_26259:35-724(-)